MPEGIHIHQDSKVIEVAASDENQLGCLEILLTRINEFRHDDFHKILLDSQHDARLSNTLELFELGNRLLQHFQLATVISAQNEQALVFPLDVETYHGGRLQRFSDHRAALPGPRRTQTGPNTSLSLKQNIPPPIVNSTNAQHGAIQRHPDFPIQNFHVRRRQYANLSRQVSSTPDRCALSDAQLFGH